MEKSEIEAQLRTLTETEARILFFKCDDFDYERIAAQFNYGSDWVQLRATEMYIKLGFPKEMSPRERKKVLKDRYCKVLTEMWDNQHPWPPEKKEPDPPASWLMVVQQEYKFEEEEKRLALHPHVEIIDPNQKIPIPPPIKRRPWWLYAIIAILLIALVYFIGRKPVPLSPLPTQTPLPTYTLFPTSTVPAIALAPTNTSIPASTPTVTPTPLPTDTSTPTITPRPTPEILIETNFKDNNLNGWTTQGKYTIIDGSITWQGQTPFTISAGDSSWVNYELQVSFTRLDTGSCDVIVGVRVNDNGDMMAVKTVRAGRLGWWSFKNGKWDWIAQNEHLVGNPPLIIDIKVQKNVFNWVGATSMTMDGFDSGGISISTTCDAMDYIKVIKLP